MGGWVSLPQRPAPGDQLHWLPGPTCVPAAQSPSFYQKQGSQRQPRSRAALSGPLERAPSHGQAWTHREQKLNQPHTAGSRAHTTYAPCWEAAGANGHQLQLVTRSRHSHRLTHKNPGGEVRGGSYLEPWILPHLQVRVSSTSRASGGPDSLSSHRASTRLKCPAWQSTAVPLLA